MITSVTQYLKPVMPDKIEATIEDFRTLSSGMEFDTVVSSGFSGGMLLPILGYRLGLKYALVRKDGWLRDSHADKELEGQLGSRWLRSMTSYRPEPPSRGAPLPSRVCVRSGGIRLPSPEESRISTMRPGPHSS